MEDFQYAQIYKNIAMIDYFISVNNYIEVVRLYNSVYKTITYIKDNNVSTESNRKLTENILHSLECTCAKFFLYNPDSVEYKVVKGDLNGVIGTFFKYGTCSHYAIDYACKRGYLDIIRFLLMSGIKPVYGIQFAMRTEKLDVLDLLKYEFNYSFTSQYVIDLAIKYKNEKLFDYYFSNN
jgi:hypothetical protein